MNITQTLIKPSIALLLSSILITTSQAEIIFDFSGQHKENQNPKAELHLKDSYQFGQEIDRNSFISLKFSSQKHNFVIRPNEISHLYAGLNLDGTLSNRSGNFQFYVDAAQNKFLGTRLDGTWRSMYDMNEGTAGKWALRLRSFYRTCIAGDAFHKAAAKGDVDFVRYCLYANVPVDRREGNGWTALHSAAFKGRVHVVKLLLKHGANIHLADKNGRTPMELAKRSKHKAVINLLRKAGGRAK